MDDVGPRTVSIDRGEILRDVDRPRTAVAGDDGGHTLGQVVKVEPCCGLENLLVGMGVQVNEPRRDNQRRDINDPSPLGDRERADGDDPIALDSDVPLVRGGSRAVDQCSPRSTMSAVMGDGLAAAGSTAMTEPGTKSRLATTRTHSMFAGLSMLRNPAERAKVPSSRVASG